MKSVLFVFTSADKNMLDKQTGWFLPEAAHPYWVLEPHAKIDFASPKGANPPVDEGSIKAYENDEECVKFLSDETVKSKLANAKKIADVNVDDYDAVFYPGGLGPAIDLVTDQDSIKLVSTFYQAGKITSAVCHGPIAFTHAVDAEGKPIVAGKKVTAFSTAEEKEYGTTEAIRFLPEESLKSVGGIFSQASNWAPYVVSDGILITGQNPASAGPVGKALLEALQK